MTVATLGLAVSSDQVVGATKALDQLTAAAKPAAQAADQLAAAGGKSETVLRAIDAAAKRVHVSTTEMEQRVDAAAAAFNQLDNAAAKAASGGTAALTTQSGLARHELVNLSRQAQDVFVSLTSGQSFGTVMIQQGTQIADVFANSNGTMKGFFGQIASGVSTVLTPMRLLGAGVLGVGAAALYLANSWSESGAKVQRALIGIGAASGATVADINSFVKANSSATGLTVGEAQNAAIEFTKTGNIAVQGLKGVGDAIHGYAILTGQDATDATKTLAEALSGDLVQGATKIDQTYGALNSGTLEYIRTLELQGDRSKAIQVILDAIAPANQKAADSVGILTKAYQALAGAMSSIKNGPTGGGESQQDQLAALQARRAAIVQQTSNPAGGLVGDVQNDVRANFLVELDKQIEEAQKKIDSFNTAPVITQLNQMSKAGDGVVKSVIPQIEQIDELQKKLATLEAAKNTPGVDRSLGQDDAATIAIQNQIAALREAMGDTERYNAQISQLSFVWGGVSQATAIALQQMQNQLPVAQAVTAADQMRAQEIATINNLLLQGKSFYDASAIAAKQLEASQAAATASVLKQVEAMKDSTKMIKAQQDGTEAQTAAAIAYKNAIESGADSTSAAALKSATLQNYMARTASDTANIAINLASAVDSLDDPAWYNRPATGFTNPNTPGEMTSGGSYPTDPNNPLFINYKYGGRGFNLDTGTGPAAFASTGGSNPDSMDAILGRLASNAYTTGGIDASISAVMARAQSLSGDANTSAVINQLSSLYDFKNSQTGDKSTQIGNIQQEIAYLNTLPSTIARDQKIADLQQSIDQLRNSTDGLNATNQELLSPYYNQDPRTSHIGFRSQGMATGGEFTVPGGYSANDNMLASIPVASGEIVSVRRPGQDLSGGGNSQTITVNLGGIVVNSGGAPVNKNAIGRTVYQATQSALRQMKAVS